MDRRGARERSPRGNKPLREGLGGMERKRAGVGGTGGRSSTVMRRGAGQHGHQGVVIRVKRKRDEDPVEALLIATEANRRSKRPMIKSLRRMFNKATLNEKKTPKPGLSNLSFGDGHPSKHSAVLSAKHPNTAKPKHSTKHLTKHSTKANGGVGIGVGMGVGGGGGVGNGGGVTTETKVFKLVHTVSEADMAYEDFSKRILEKLKKAKARSGGLKVGPLSLRERRRVSTARAEHWRRFENMQRYRVKGAKNIQLNNLNKSGGQGLGKDLSVGGEVKLLDVETTNDGAQAQSYGHGGPSGSDLSSLAEKHGFENMRLQKNATPSRLDVVTDKYHPEKPSGGSIDQFFSPKKHVNSHLRVKPRGKPGGKQAPKSKCSSDAGTAALTHDSKAAVMDRDVKYVYDFYCLTDIVEADKLDTNRAAFVDIRGLYGHEILINDFVDEWDDDDDDDDDDSEQEVDYPEEEFSPRPFDHSYRSQADRSQASSSSDLLTDQLWFRGETTSCSQVTLADLRKCSRA
ncbi:hypothetical protein AAMO2058_001409700 [Amorphochlora amoebiformis]